MDLPHVDTCCFGLLPLKTGSLISGIVALIVETSFHGYSSTYGSGHSDNTIRLIYQVLLICGIVGAILLIVGILMNRSSFAKLFIIAFALLIIFSIVMCIWVLLKVRGDHADLIISTIIYVCVVGYCLIVVNSYYKTMG